MAMISYVWRPRAKIVAVIDASLGVITFVYVAIVAILASIAVAVVQIVATGLENASNKANENNAANQENSAANGSKVEANINTKAIWMLWVGIAITAVLTGVRVLAAWKLMKSTETRRSTQDALSGARIFLYLNIFMTLVTIVVTMVLFGHYVMPAIDFVLRVIMLFVVFQYIDELKVTLNVQNINRVEPMKK